MSYSTVNTKISQVGLQSSNKVYINTTSVNVDTFEYEDIDYSQAETPSQEYTVFSAETFKETYGNDNIKYVKNGEIVTAKIKDSMFYLTCSEDNYNYYVNTAIKGMKYEDVVNNTAKYNAIYNYVTYNNIELDDNTLQRLEKLSSIHDEYKNKLENIEPTKLSYVDEVQGLLDILNKELSNVDNKIKPLQEEYDTNYIIITHPVFLNPNGINDKALEACQRIRPDLDDLKSQKAMLETYIYQMEHELALAPYKDMMDTQHYKNFFKNYNGEYKNYIDSNMDVAAIKSMQEEYNTAMITVKNPVWFNPNNVNTNAYNTVQALGPKLEVLNNFMYMSEDERHIYTYLLETKGKDAALEYLKIIEDSINQAKGAEAAAKFISTLDLNDKGKLEKNLANFMGVSKRGLSDGIDTFFAGLENVLINNDSLTAEEYEKMIVLQYLQENSKYYDEIYAFNSSLGNMLPAMATSAIVTVLATPAAGSVTGTALMGLSAGGNAKHQALVEGNSLLSSWIYGIFVGGSEATLGYFLGKIPGISQTSGFTLSNLLSEGAEEFLQEWIDAGLQAVILGKDVDWASIPKQSVDAFIMGVLMSGFLNGGQAIINISINGIVQEINIQKTLKLLEQNPNMSVYDAMLQASGIDPMSITDTEQYLKNKAEFESLIDGEEFMLTQIDNYCEDTEIYVQSSLSSTATMVSIQKLQLLLLTDEALNKFNNFESNMDFFDNSKENYILAMEQYYQILQKNGFNITETMQARYDAIMSQSSKIHSFGDMLNQDFYQFSLFGQDRSVTTDYLDSIIFDEAGYNRFAQIVNNQSNRANVSNLTAPFFAIYQQIKQQGVIIDPIVEERIMNLSNAYVAVRNSYRTVLADYSYYGADQHAIQNIARNPSSNQALYSQVEAIAQSYFPDLSKSKINKLLRATDTCGICSYATVINEILLNFSDKPDLFRQYFGYDMYRIENGQKVLNDELLLTDLYCYANKNNPYIVQKGLFGYKISENDKNQNYMSLGRRMDSKNVVAINGWLQSKGINLTWNTDVIYMIEGAGTAPLAARNITGKVQQALLEGHTLEIDALTDSNTPMDLTLYTLDATKYPDNKISGTHAWGHSMTVTGITENGDLIVASWGKEYYLKWTELSNVAITINESNLQ